MRIAIISSTNKIIKIILVTILISTVSSLIVMKISTPQFNGKRAMADVAYQMSVGPRTIGSTAHAQVREYITATLEDEGWQVEIQEFEQNGIVLYNIIAKKGSGTPWIVLGAHYDTRLAADRDPNPDKRNDPVPGANDGASGVAVLLELSRSLPEDLDKQIWLVFFDAEDNGRLPGWDWILGSRYFVSTLDGQPQAAIIVDMIGDQDLQIYLEKNSDAGLASEIWDQARALGYEQFVPEYRYQILDDHIPFLEAGIPAVDIIDFDYPYWHTTGDTLERVSTESLDAVGETLLSWILR